MLKDFARKAWLPAAAAMLLAGQMAPASAQQFPATTTVGVLPELHQDWQSGNVSRECIDNLGYEFGIKANADELDLLNGGLGIFCDGANDRCDFADEFATTISQLNDGDFIDWTSTPLPLGAVVVKGGKNGANVFEYDPSAFNDTGLYAPCNSNDRFDGDGILIARAGQCLPGDEVGGKDGVAGISHVSFCWNESDIDGKCWEGETAWAVGEDFNTSGGSWAMYVPYDGAAKQVHLRAGGGDGEGEIVGTVLFVPDGDGVLITINLDNGVIFYHEAASEDADGEHNIKIQGYDNPPRGNPKIGRFDGKSEVIGESTGSVLMEYYNYYAVHVDVAIQVDCEE